VTHRLLIVILACAGITLQAQPSAEEDVRVRKAFHKTPLAKVLKVLEKRYSTRIAYDHALVQNIIVDLKVSGTDLPSCLEQVLKNTPPTFQQVGGNVIILPRPPEPFKASIARTFTLAGNVIDADTEETLPQATLTVRGTTLATTTNTDGYFTLPGIPSDTLVLDVRYLGYITQAIRLHDVTAGTLRIRLKSDTRILNEVVVLDEYNQAIHVEPVPGAVVFNPSAVNTLPSLGEQDMTRTLQLIPGIAATDESSAGAVIRGAHPGYNLTLLDGMTIYQQDHFFGAFSIINADIIKDIRVHKGMFDAQYGGRVSGVIDITTKNGAVKPAFNVKINAINIKGTAELPITRRLSLFVAARRSFTDVAQSYLFKTLFDIARTSNDQVGILSFKSGTGDQPRPAYYFFDTNTKLSFRPTDRDMMSLSLYVSRDDMHTQENYTAPSDTDTLYTRYDDRTRWGNNGVSLRWGRQWRNNYYSNIRVSTSRFFRRYEHNQRNTLDQLDYTYTANLDNTIDDVSYALDNEWTLNQTWAMAWGVAGTRQTTTVDIRDRYLMPDTIVWDEVPENTSFSEDESSWQHAFYGSFTVTASDRLTLTAGARLVYYANQQHVLRLEPRATARYQVSEQLHLKAGYGRSSQFITQRFSPSYADTVSGIQENYWILSRPRDVGFPVVTSDHVSAGTTWKRTQFTYDADVYYKVSHGVIIDDNLNAGDTHAYGLEVIAQKTRGVHTGWIAYTLSRTTQSNPYLFEGRRAPAWQDQRHEVKVVDMLALGRWNLATTLVYGSGKPFPAYTVRYFRDSDDLIDDYVLQLDYRNEQRLPAYFSIDVSASYRLQWKRGRMLEMGLSIHNVTDHKNIKGRLVDTSALDRTKGKTTELPVSYRDLPLMGISPTLFINIGF
jgi:ferric enterobactin receptor